MVIHIVSYVLTFIGGVLSKWFQGLLQDRKKEWDSLKEETLRPIRVQVYNAVPQLQQNARVNCVDLQLWDRLVAASKDREVPDDLRTVLRRLYVTDIPAHTRAWFAVNEEVNRVMVMADVELGGNHAGADLPAQPWGNFLLSDTFDPSLISWSTGGRARLWNMELDRMKFIAPPATREELLRKIWTEGNGRLPIQQFRKLRAECLTDARVCLQLLDAALEGNFFIRMSRSLHRKLP
jgi:hypothetical protein